MSTRDTASAPPPTPSPGGGPGDAFDMLKNLWGLAGVPGMPGSSAASAGPLAQLAKGVPPMMPNLLLPTFDVKELDKRITDLRAVEQWLQLNASMLRATIQALEVQRSTIATMQQFGETMLAPPRQAPSESAPAPAPTSSAPAPLDPAAWWNTLQQQFSQIAAATAAGAAAGAQAEPPPSRHARKRPSRA